MQGGHLVVLLPHDEEHGVQQVYELGEEVPPAQAEDPEGVLVVGVVDRLAVPAVVARHKEGPALCEHPEAEESLTEVVDDHDPLDVVRLSTLHELWAGNLTWNIIIADCETTEMWFTFTT